MLKIQFLQRLTVAIGLLGALCLVQCGGSADDPSDTTPKSTDPSDGDTESDGDTGEPEYEVALLIDDFEDGDYQSIDGGFWFTYTDSGDDGASSMEITLDDDGNVVADGEGYESERSFTISYALDQGDWAYEPYIGWGVNLGDETAPYDASGFGGITYTFKGSAHLVLIQTNDVTDYDDFIATVPAADDWTTVYLPFTNFAQAGWGIPVDFNLDNVRNIGWQVKGATGDEGTISMDDVAFLGDDGGPEAEPDMEINDPDPPEDETLDSIEMDNPVQAVALETLSKGYNLTNWLEQEKFEAYEYDEEYVNALAENGFKALRLPIDLDRYIADRAAYFEGEADFEVEPLLFEILDSFEQWTAAAGLSLTVDYHQYDGSFDMDDPLYVDAVIRLWTAVAAHFADNPREDLFFELMNEPELAGDVSSVSANDWTDFATQIIDGIRSEDPNRVILFGDVEWNGISPLTQRTPFEDDRMVYVFHFYEPFVFTHQGASWAGLGTARNIPYPYSADRWSEYSSDFGFLASTEGWLFSALRQYYKTGNKSWIRNQIIEAKRWSVENDVPVVCNEFGVFDRTSTEEDRLRYYTDLIDVFEELEIPWQHWFMVMDDSGAVNEDLKAAFGLD